MKPIEWKEVSQRLGPPTHRAMVGKVVVGYAGWSSFRSKGDPEAYDYQCHLPTLKNAKGSRRTLEEAKKRVEALVEFWFKEVT